MGSAYGNPNLGKILATIIIMISDKTMMAKYPLEELDQAIVSHKDILAKMIDPGDGSNVDFSELLTSMAVDNAKISKKMAKTYLKGLAKTQNEALATALRQIRSFLKIDDTLKASRREWIFGIPQVVSKQNFRSGSKKMQYGSEAVDLISDDYITFKTGCFKGVTNGYLGQMMQSKGRMDT